MLKIKDDVDLKKLERYGFSVHAPIKQPEYKTYIHNSISIYGDVTFEKTDFTFPRRLMIKSTSIETMDCLYNLISDGLVEKI